MPGTEIVSLPHTRDTLGKIGRSCPCFDQVSCDLAHRPRVWFGTHQSDLSPRPLERPGADRVALRGVSIEQVFRGPSLDDGGEFPAKIHCVTQPQIHALPPERGVHMSCIARQQHTARAVTGCLPGIVGEPGRRKHACDRDIRSGHVAQARLQFLRSHRSVAVGWRSFKLDDEHAVRARAVDVDAGRSAIPSRVQRARIGDLDNRRICRDFGRCSGKGKARQLTHRASSAVAADQPTGPNSAGAGMYRDRVVCLREGGDGHSPADRNSEIAGPPRQHLF